MSHIDTVRDMAYQNGGTIRLTDAAKAIHASGQSRSNVSNLRISLYHLVEQADDFEWVAPGTVRVLTRACEACNGSGRVPLIPEPAPTGPERGEE